MSQKVYVGMSGGVDSSVTAALLKEQGYDVVGIYMKNWATSFPGFDCPWREDLNDAKRVALRLRIPLRVYDFQRDYKEKVVEYMIDEYVRGRTPNPDIMCNQEIKFRLFLESAVRDGAEMIATGHYARTQDGRLFKARDNNKDQTYFLCRVSGDALKQTLFPLGDMTKDQVRAKARELNLSTAEKKDSQGICFVGKVGIREFLEQFVETESGPIVDQKGHEIGVHDGAIFYTVGQRSGLGVGGGKAYYVTHKDMEKNTVYVTNELSDQKLWAKEITINDINWINEQPSNSEVEVRTRYRGELENATISTVNDKRARVTLAHEQRAVTPGQSLVVYRGDELLGSGIVESID